MMSVLRYRTVYPVSVILLGSVAVWAFAQQSPVKKPEPATIHVMTFHDAKIIGYLGEPLGTIVRVGGVSVDGTTLRLKGYDGETILRINTVNGKKLKDPIDFKFPYNEKSIAKPPFGKRFDYVVHEWGAFDG
jgi:hypothetical protein